MIIDQDNKKNIFESGAILMYLAEQSGKFYDTKDRLEINQWLMAQMGYVGPMLGQHHQFHHYNPGKSKFGEERYFKISKRIYEELDNRLSELLGDKKNISQKTKLYFKNNHSLDIDKLYVKEAFVGKSIVMKRFHARARGRGARILKPFSHLTIILSEQEGGK